MPTKLTKEEKEHNAELSKAKKKARQNQKNAIRKFTPEELDELREYSKKLDSEYYVEFKQLIHKWNFNEGMRILESEVREERERKKEEKL